MFVAPSVLSLDYSRFNEQIEILNSKCKFIHFDVMDGHFVPNLTFGPDIFKAFRKNSSLFMDVHLMVDDPDFFANVFIDAGADGITFHYESYDDVEECLKLIKKIKSRYVKVGISIKPNTPVDDIVELLPFVDLVLVMSVEPGFGGQKFQESSLEKIEALDSFRKNNSLSYLIQIDGGINDQNAHRVVEAGCDILVAGSYVFNGDIVLNIDSITFYE